jgi:DNA-binding MurR/RpiR family transcriptional regulator
MEKSESLRVRIANLVDTLSPKQKQIARFILDDQYFTPFASANELGKKNNTTAATVVRFAQTLGYEGYSEMQAVLRSEFPNNITTIARMQKRMSEKSLSSSNPQQAFFTDIKNIERTAVRISEKDLKAAMDAIISARRILVIGAGLSYAPAAFLTHSLKVMGFNAIAVQGEVLRSAVDISRIEAEDLMIAIDLWRYVRMTVNAVSQAKKTGSYVIGITDSLVSPVAQMADISFEIATEGIAHSLSITALLSLLNVFIVMLADRVPEQVYESLKRVDDVYQSNDLLVLK